MDGREREKQYYCSILTEDDENSIVSDIKNKNRALQGVNRSDVTKLIMDVLKIRSYANKRMKGGEKYLALSKNAKNALEKTSIYRYLISEC